MIMKCIEIMCNRPTTEFLADIEFAGITVIGRSQPNWYFKERRTFTNDLKTDRGWIDPRNIDHGSLIIEFDNVEQSGTSEDSSYLAHDTVYKLGERHGIDVAIGGWTSLK